MLKKAIWWARDGFPFPEYNQSFVVRWTKYILVALFLILNFFGMRSIQDYAKWEFEHYVIMAFIQGNLIAIWLNEAFIENRKIGKRIIVSILCAFACFGISNMTLFIISVFNSPALIEIDSYRLLVFIGSLFLTSIVLGALVAVIYALFRRVKLFIIS
jgi:hypothetical protein